MVDKLGPAISSLWRLKFTTAFEKGYQSVEGFPIAYVLHLGCPLLEDCIHRERGIVRGERVYS